jgi:hypothetical protein
MNTNFNNGTNIIAKRHTILQEDEILEFFMGAMVK